MYCKDCDENYDVIYNNVPWLSPDYCPFCGGENVDYDGDDDEVEGE
jgi:hypothetical protein